MSRFLQTFDRYCTYAIGRPHGQSQAIMSLFCFLPSLYELWVSKDYSLSITSVVAHTGKQPVGRGSICNQTVRSSVKSLEEQLPPMPVDRGSVDERKPASDTQPLPLAPWCSMHASPPLPCVYQLRGLSSARSPLPLLSSMALHGRVHVTPVWRKCIWNQWWSSLGIKEREVDVIVNVAQQGFLLFKAKCVWCNKRNIWNVKLKRLSEWARVRAALAETVQNTSGESRILCAGRKIALSHLSSKPNHLLSKSNHLPVKPSALQCCGSPIRSLWAARSPPAPGLLELHYPDCKL